MGASKTIRADARSERVGLATPAQPSSVSRRPWPAHWSNVPLLWKGLVVVAIPSAALMLTALSLGRVSRSEQRAATAVRHSESVQRDIQDVLTLLLNAETGVRGYLITREPQFLQPYQTAQRELSPSMSDLAELIGGDADQAGAMRTVTSLAGSEMATLATLRDRTESGQAFPPIDRDSLLVQGKQTMDRLRAQLAEMQRDEQARLAASLVTQRVAQARMSLLVRLALLALAVGLVATILFARGTVGRLRRLELNSDRLAGGMPLVEPPAGKDEIGRLGAALDKAGTLLGQREAELRESEERFRLLAENSKDVITRFRLGDNPGLEYVSPAVTKLTGRTPDEFYSHPELLSSVIHPEDRDRLSDILNHPERVTEPITVRIFGPDGSLVWVESQVKVIRDGEGRPVAVQTTARDITARIRADQALRESEALKTSVLESIADGTVITDRQGSIISINPAMEALTGWSQDEVRGRPLLGAYRIFDGRGRPKRWEELLIYQAMETGRGRSTRGYDQTLLARDGRRIPFAGKASPLIDPDGKVFGGVELFRDVSYEREVDQLKSALVSTVSHELRTPLTMIKGFSELLLSRELGRDQSREALAQINASAERLSRLIDDLLSVSRIESGRLVVRTAPVAVGDVIGEVVAGFAERDRFDVSVDERLPPALADRDMLVQIVTNLLSNAVKYSAPGTAIAVTATERERAVETAVRDHGIGMAKDELASLFNKFFRADRQEVRKAGGTGLGLYITKNLVEMQGGHIWVKSKVGRGSVFAFSIPVADGRAAEEVP